MKTLSSNHSVIYLISSFLFCPTIYWWCKWFELQYSAITTTQFVPNINAEGVKSYVWHDSFIPVSWIIHTCDMTQSIHATWLIWCLRHDSFIRVSQLIHACAMTQSIRVTWLFHTYDMTHLYMWHESFYMFDMTDSHFKKWPIHMFDMTHLYLWHDSFTHTLQCKCMTWLIHTYTTIHACDMTHSHVQ